MDLKKKIKCVYKDIPNLDSSENIFYIYYLGRYNNKHTYHYGETHDICNIDFELAKKVPLYNKLIYVPINHHVDGYDKFLKFIQENKMVLSLPLDIDNVFITNDQSSINDVLLFVSDIFKEVEAR